MRKAVLLLAAGLLATSPCLADSNPSVEAIYGGVLPAGYDIIKSGGIERAESRGNYLLMRHERDQTMALVLLTTGLAKEDPLLDSNLTRVARHLFERYVFEQGAFEVAGGLKYKLSPRPRPVARRLYVRFSDEFLEPDLIARQCKMEHCLIAMVGRPSDGGITAEGKFNRSFTRMEAVLNALIRPSLLYLP